MSSKWRGKKKIKEIPPLVRPTFLKEIGFQLHAGLHTFNYVTDNSQAGKKKNPRITKPKLYGSLRKYNTKTN